MEQIAPKIVQYAFASELGMDEEIMRLNNELSEAVEISNIAIATRNLWQTTIAEVTGETTPADAERYIRGIQARCDRLFADVKSQHKLIAELENKIGELQDKRPASEVLREQIGGTHYLKMKIQPMEFCLKNNLDFATSSAVKYLVRKKGNADKRREDLKKAVHCIHLLADSEGLQL